MRNCLLPIVAILDLLEARHTGRDSRVLGKDDGLQGRRHLEDTGRAGPDESAVL